jgi:hypothetical protein
MNEERMQQYRDRKRERKKKRKRKRKHKHTWPERNRRFTLRVRKYRRQERKERRAASLARDDFVIGTSGNPRLDSNGGTSGAKWVDVIKNSSSGCT